MTDFLSDHTVTARKQHPCAHCKAKIEIGDKHRYVAQVWEGDFHAYREHFECHKAWNELNFSRDMRGIGFGEGALFLKDDDEIEQWDRDWMRDHHPIVAGRLGWTGKEIAA